jgi:hypothetical protein
MCRLVAGLSGQRCGLELDLGVVADFSAACGARESPVWRTATICSIFSLQSGDIARGNCSLLSHLDQRNIFVGGVSDGVYGRTAIKVDVETGTSIMPIRHGSLSTMNLLRLVPESHRPRLRQ